MTDPDRDRNRTAPCQGSRCCLVYSDSAAAISERFPAGVATRPPVHPRKTAYSLRYSERSFSGQEPHDSRMGFAAAFDGRLSRSAATRDSRRASGACALWGSV